MRIKEVLIIVKDYTSVQNVHFKCHVIVTLVNFRIRGFVNFSILFLQLEKEHIFNTISASIQIKHRVWVMVGVLALHAQDGDG